MLLAGAEAVRATYSNTFHFVFLYLLVLFSLPAIKIKAVSIARTSPAIGQLVYIQGTFFHFLQ